MQSRVQRIQTWIKTVHTTRARDSDELPSRDRNEITASDTTSDDSSCSILINAEDDPLIPSSVKIKGVYCDGQETWARLLERARKLPEGHYPSTLGNLCILMKDVPALPQPLPRSKGLWGWAVWKLSSPPHLASSHHGSTSSSA
ncbi:hypothetical protein F5B17DRAFT_243633 [Nemania serpens]|nr:hypothetical protein F5B17DRAFT_243633 [Nemania serpens]